MFAVSIRYVRAGGSGDGSSWANASGDLQAMINVQGVQQVWVAAGTYKPTTGTDRSISFSMKNGVSIYGGFAGTGNPGMNDRNPSSYVTILSAEIGVAGKDDNSYHVIKNTNLTNTAVLDGFTIQDGNANGSLPDNYGGGVLNLGNGGTCSPQFYSCTFVNNSASTRGGGMFNDGANGGTSSPALMNCSFQSNFANSEGGGVYNDGYKGTSSPILINCSFLANAATTRGGALYNTGYDNGTSNPVLTNCSFQANSSSDGSLMRNDSDANGTASPVLTNCVLFNNSGANAIKGGGVTVQYSLLEQTVTGYTDGGNNRTTGFSPFTSTTTTQLTSCAPALNAGNNHVYNSAGGPTTDLAGASRFYNNGTIDMGAYELQSDPAYVSVGLPNLNTATVGSPFSVTFTASGGSGFTYSIANGTLPMGLNLSAQGQLSGTPTQAGSFTVTVAAQNSSGCTGTSVIYQLTVTNTTPTISGLAINPAVVCTGSPVNVSAIVGNITGSYNYTLSYGQSIRSGSSTTPNFDQNVTTAGSGLQTFTLTVNSGGQTTNALAQVTVNELPITTLQASAMMTTNQPITVTATGCETGTVNWQLIGGTGQASGSLYTLSQPGNYTLSASCTSGSCAGPVSPALILQIRPGGFTITQVTMVSCVRFDEVKGGYQVRFTPLYSGQNNNPISFSVVNELAPTQEVAPYSLRLYTDNPRITLVATQQGNPETRFMYDWLASCQSGTAPNRAPTSRGIPTQRLINGQPYQLLLTDYFSDPDGQTLTFSAQGLPTQLTVQGNRISGTPTQTGDYTVRIIALDPEGLSASSDVTFSVAQAPASGNFAINGVTTVACEQLSVGERRLTFSPQYAGLDGSPVTFAVTNELLPTTQAGPYMLRMYTDNPVITLVAKQGSTQTEFTYNWLAACNLSASRRGVAEPETVLQVKVLGNPIQDRQVRVEVSGAQGQPLHLELRDVQGRLVSEQMLPQAGSTEACSLKISQESAGLILLRVSTPTQQQTVKLLNR
ncbi:hypothetical protein GCM10027592_18490 [Spirosoma flavus]